jgi:hypothetical protein
MPCCNAMTSVFSSLLEDNTDKDRLSSQLTYKANIADFNAPGMIVTSLLEHHPPTPLLLWHHNEDAE